MTGAAWVTEEELDALCEIAEQASRFLDLDWGYLDAGVREGLERLVRAVSGVGVPSHGGAGADTPAPTAATDSAWLAVVTLTDALRRGEVEISDRDDVIWLHVLRRIAGRAEPPDFSVPGDDLGY